MPSPTASNVGGYDFLLLFHFILDPFYFPFFRNYENFLVGFGHPFLFLNIISESIFPSDLGRYDTALCSVHCLVLDATSEGCLNIGLGNGVGFIWGDTYYRNV